MLDHLISSPRRLRTTLAAAGALFLVVLVLLAVQLSLGRDPSVGDRAAGAQQVTVTVQRTAPPTDDGDTVVAEQGAAPLQSGTS